MEVFQNFKRNLNGIIIGLTNSISKNIGSDSSELGLCVSGESFLADAFDPQICTTKCKRKPVAQKGSFMLRYGMVLAFKM